MRNKTYFLYHTKSKFYYLKFLNKVREVYIFNRLPFFKLTFLLKKVYCNLIVCNNFNFPNNGNS